MTRIISKYMQMLLFSLLAAFLLTACGGGSSGGSGDFGALETSLTDAFTDEYQAVYVTIDRVEVHMGAEGSEDEALWETVAEPCATYNLLELVNGVRETLGIASLPAGHYTQMRLIIGTTPDQGLNIFSQPHLYANYVIDENDEEHQLKVPSGLQTGLKIVKGFEISAGETTELLLDFDAMRSVVKAGASGQYLLKPTVKVLDTRENAIVSGSVFYNSVTVNSAILEPVAGAMVTAQMDDSTALEPEDEVVIAAGTVAEDDGQYALFLQPDTYNLVATAAGYNAACLSRGLTAGEVASLTDFILVEDGEPGTVTGVVDLGAASAADQYATLDFRQELVCIDEGAAETLRMATVKSINVADLGTYEVDLPAGDYELVASSFGLTTEVYNVAVVSGGTATQDVDFPAP